MLHIDDQTLREGLDRAHDLFKLHRLSVPDEADELVAAVFANFGIDAERHTELSHGLRQLLPVSGDPLAEDLMTASMGAGVLVGLLIANTTIGREPDTVPDHVPTDL